MATRSTISVVQEDGSVKSVYCHWDGYPQGGVGGELKGYFYDYQAANKVISEGDLSSINGGIFTSYNSLKGEKVIIKEFKDFDSYWYDFDRETYNYLFRNGQWLVQYKTDSFDEY